ncbi:glutathione S-transferase family protein [Polaromonas sp.]|uniref:glutathione S-transferase family protein n=1 Tax=Polaromonas sp. TaxID=1869339 RepID=UPI002FC8F846
MKLYYNPKSRAAIAKWMLDECGADYEIVLIDLEKREHKTPAFLSINPAGKLPALLDGHQRLYETPAICLYLAEKFPQAKLAPEPGAPGRGRFLSLMMYSTAQLEPSMGDSMMKVETHPQRGWDDFETVKNVIEQELGHGPYLLGEQFTAADIMVGSMFMWLRLWGVHTGRARLEAYIDRLAARPAAMKMG